MPTRERGTSEVRCRPLGNLRLNMMLRNPVYAGTYVFGRHPIKTMLIDGEIRKVRARIDAPSEWPVRIDNAHPAYISWETYVKNQEKLHQNTTRAGVAAGLGGSHFQRDRRCPGTHPLARRRFFALPAGARRRAWAKALTNGGAPEWQVLSGEGDVPIRRARCGSLSRGRSARRAR
jgi:hypothetical protein